VENAEHDDTIRVVVLAAAGDKGLSAGMDLRSIAAVRTWQPPEAFSALFLLAGEVASR